LPHQQPLGIVTADAVLRAAIAPSSPSLGPPATSSWAPTGTTSCHGILGAGHDFAERRRAEAELAESEQGAGGRCDVAVAEAGVRPFREEGFACRP